MYYGAADSVVCLATASVEVLLDHVMTPCAEAASRPTLPASPRRRRLTVATYHAGSANLDADDFRSARIDVRFQT